LCKHWRYASIFRLPFLDFIWFGVHLIIGLVDFILACIRVVICVVWLKFQLGRVCSFFIVKLVCWSVDSFFFSQFDLIFHEISAEL
jgi:hypothetical protein